VRSHRIQIFQFYNIHCSKYLQWCKFNNNTYQQICEALSKTVWTSLNSSDAEACYNIIIDNINNVIEYFAPKTITKIPGKHVIREPCTTPRILHSSKHLDKLYKQQLGKENESREHIKYITYRNKN